MLHNVGGKPGFKIIHNMKGIDQADQFSSLYLVYTAASTPTKDKYIFSCYHFTFTLLYFTFHEEIERIVLQVDKVYSRFSTNPEIPYYVEYRKLPRNVSHYN